MAQGNYEHPSFLTQQILPINIPAGAAAVRYWSPPFAVRIPEVTAAVITAGTADVAAAGGVTIAQDGTAKGTISLSTHAAGVMGTARSLGITVPANGTLALTAGTDATAVRNVFVHWYIDPAATWNT